MIMCCARLPLHRCVSSGCVFTRWKLLGTHLCLMIENGSVYTHTHTHIHKDVMLVCLSDTCDVLMSCLVTPEMMEKVTCLSIRQP